MKENLTLLSALQENLNRYLTRLPNTQPLSPDQPPSIPLAPLQRQQENPHHLSQQNQPLEEKPKRVK